MSEFEKKKIITNKNRNFSRDSGSSTSRYTGRSTASSKGRESTASTEPKQPTILLKNKDAVTEDSANKKKPTENDSVLTMPAQSTKEHYEEGVRKAFALPLEVKQMKKSMKLIEDGVIDSDHLQEYMQENSDFVVVGVVGPQGVGKSTILNLLSDKKLTPKLKQNLFKTNLESHKNVDNAITILTDKLDDDDEAVFKVESLDNIENCTNATQGIDIYVSPNRIIFLDCQPCLSVAVLDELIESENKRTNLVNDFIPLENSGEIQALQYTAFLMSVCHILLVVQDWFFDSNVVRFIQTAEMLKPTISSTEDEYCEHFPHLIMIQNKAQIADFTPKQFKVMKKVYETLFQKTKLQFHSNLGLSSNRIINTVNKDNPNINVNLFLIPEVTSSSQSEVYSGHPPLEDLIKWLRANLYGATKNPLTHIQLTEKTWLIYCNKVWETVKKSPFFVEYTKLMP